MSGSLVRKRHRALVLGVLRSGGPLTKADIARRLGLSVPTITQILRDFEREGAVVPMGAGRSSGGRRPMLYRLRTDGLRAIGVSIDPDRISAVVSDLSGAIAAETGTEIDLDEGEEAFESALTRIVDDLLVALGPAASLAGIGVAAPAMMRRSQGGVFLPIGRPDWTGVDLLAALGKRFHLPVVAENRAHAVGVGEYLFGAGQGTSDLLCLMIGSGLGAAILTDGHLFTGGDGAAGAIGRMIVDTTGDEGARTAGDLVGAYGIVRSALTRLRTDG
ncbi:MAG TPA: ROK family transcriptional regulator, partial [Actinopolymorphaceae bacterium]